MRDRAKLLSYLLSLREMRLREEIGALKGHVATLDEIQCALSAARARASEAITSAPDLRSLGLIAEVRATSMARALKAQSEIRVASDRVAAAHRRAEAMRSAKGELAQANQLKREQSQDLDNEQFHAWKRGLGPRR